MKQNITLQQWNELSTSSKQKLFEWSKTCDDWQREVNEGDYDSYVCILSIGQMIEFLQDKVTHEGSYIDNYFDHNINGDFGIGWDGELCDGLWKSVKEVLEI